MQKYTAQERAELRELGEKYGARLKVQRRAAYDALKEEVKEFAQEIKDREEYQSKLFLDLAEGLGNGTYKKPSEFLEKKAKALFNGWILPVYKKYVWYAVDHCTLWSYKQTGLFRRSFRTKNTMQTAKLVMEILDTYSRETAFGICVTDLLKGNLSKEQQGYRLWQYCNWTDDMGVACEIDSGNTECIALVRDVLNGVSEVAPEPYIIRGVLKSGNTELHELLGKLLLAARLEEGLRQAICENADCGTAESFLEIVRVITENDLIHFSSVKRAVGVWLGLLPSNQMTRKTDLERISEKSIRLVSECLTEPEKRERYLSSEDSMELYIALWSYGVFEVMDMLDKIYLLSKQGSHHQVLTAGYAAVNLNGGVFAEQVAKEVIRKHAKEHDIVAVYMESFMKNVDRILRENMIKTELLLKMTAFEGRSYYRYQTYFESVSEAEAYYETLKGIYESLQTKEERFEPCIFPWYSAELSKTQLLVRLAFLANVLKDNERIDEVVVHLPEIDATCNERAMVLCLLLCVPETKYQRRVLVECIGNKDTSTRTYAYAAVKKLMLTAEEYSILEELLKYKNAELRTDVIGLLRRQDDAALYTTIERLYRDKKEEKRTAALDLMLQLGKEPEKRELFQKCRALIGTTESVSTKEKILIEEILKLSDGVLCAPEQKVVSNGNGHYTPETDADYVTELRGVFERYFPNAEKKSERGFVRSLLKTAFSLKKNAAEERAHETVLDKLVHCIEAHRDEEYRNGVGETVTLTGRCYSFRTTYEGEEKSDIPFRDVWNTFYREEIGSPELLYRAYVGFLSEGDSDEYSLYCGGLVRELIGDEFSAGKRRAYHEIIAEVLSYLVLKYVSEYDRECIAFYTALKLSESRKNLYCAYDTKSSRGGSPDIIKKMAVTQNDQIAYLLSGMKLRREQRTDVLIKNQFAVRYALQMRLVEAERKYRFYHTSPVGVTAYVDMCVRHYVEAGFYGFISECFLYRCLFAEDERVAKITRVSFETVLKELSRVVSGIREISAPVSTGKSSYFAKLSMREFFGEDKPDTEYDKDWMAYIEGIYLRLMEMVLPIELKRGDSATEYSDVIHSIYRIYGVEKYVELLAALGSETLERGVTYWSRETTKQSNFSHLLAVCVPNETDSADDLKRLVEKTDITEARLIEAAMYSPEWLTMTEAYLGWDGLVSACYYFMAHMNERFDDRRMAMIAKYTPLSAEELRDGAFDITWFWEAYRALGEKRFQLVYDAAKYIADGAKHSRARKYADAVTGKLDKEETEEQIRAKRNKDLLMAYALLPITGEKDLLERYLFLEQFAKESKKFGAQRQASERQAVDMAKKNLSLNAGLEDVMRLTLRMEAKLMENNRAFFEEKQIGEVAVWLEVGADGKTELRCVKDGKKLASVPAKYKKDEYVVELLAAKKKFNEQYSRAVRIFEQAMEDETEFTVDEIGELFLNPVTKAVLGNLLVEVDDAIGFFEEVRQKGMVLRIVHPYHLYKAGMLRQFQEKVFELQAVQPFKQVFRELYVKTEEEREMKYSQRYAGNQIQPRKVVAVLKSRRWVADIEDGLQKVYYKENIIARIYAQADWFTPSDIEAPTLEWVEFSERKTGRSLKIEEIPDVIFSEVMRDVDLAVSVAHAGGVDPETSHSTMEMRAALLEFVLPLFGLSNVEVKGSHAHITGKRADYTVHLGSGVVHQKGGTMLNVLPVHSAHRGKLFLPFADDDPKTAEVLTKVLWFAEDEKIKDPSVLAQLNR